MIVGQKRWMPELFTEKIRAVTGTGRATVDPVVLGRTLMLLHKGALVAHGMDVLPRPVPRGRTVAERRRIGG